MYITFLLSKEHLTLHARQVYQQHMVAGKRGWSPGREGKLARTLRVKRQLLQLGGVQVRHAQGLTSEARPRRLQDEEISAPALQDRRSLHRGSVAPSVQLVATMPDCPAPQRCILETVSR